jgi:hypothetical protein
MQNRAGGAKGEEPSDDGMSEEVRGAKQGAEGARASSRCEAGIMKQFEIAQAANCEIECQESEPGCARFSRLASDV